MGIHVYVTLDALLAHIGPAVARHPLALALGTLVLAETPLLTLIRRQALAFRSCLRKFNISILLTKHTKREKYQMR